MKNTNKRRPNGYWTKETVIKEINDRATNGESLTHSLVRKEDSSLLVNGEKIFGKWRDALTAAGIDYNEWYIQKPKGHWTEEKLIEELWKRKRAGKGLRYIDVLTEDSPLSTSLVKRYGTWRQVLLAANLAPETEVRKDKPKVKKKQTKWSKNKVKEELLKRKEQNLSLALKDITKEYPSLRQNMIKYFGSTFKAYKATGENPEEHMENIPSEEWTEEFILRLLQTRKNSGLPMDATSMDKEAHGLYMKALKTIGRWKVVLSRLE